MGCVLAVEHTVWGGSARTDEGVRRVLAQDIARCRLRDCKEYAHERRQIRENQCDEYQEAYAGGTLCNSFHWSLFP